MDTKAIEFPAAKSQRETWEEKQAKRKAQRQIGAAVLAKKKPDWAKAAIVAFFRSDESDTMVDYFGHSDGEPVIIAWSKHTRDLFGEMRKAAAASGMEEIAHMGPGCDLWMVSKWRDERRDMYAGSFATPEGIDKWTTEADAQAAIDAVTTRDNENRRKMQAGEIKSFCPELPYGAELRCESIEHREKYSMGNGYYLSAQYGLSSAWVVEKWPLADYMRERLEVAAGRKGGYRVPQKVEKIHRPPRGLEQMLRGEGGAIVEKHWHSKRGVDFWLVVLGDRVDRPTFDAIRERCKAAGGWYSRAWQATPGGFAFEDESAALEFAATV